ncbi:hypothetical protein B0H13DRAFT_2126736 [Mycena leptocephala]|nr:hypothetical protein B0H13DRAFT_2126736 [Mycena leptocephala]
MSLPTTMLTADEFMARVGSLPYLKRHGFATKLALENDQQLPKLIEQLLATAALPSRILTLLATLLHPSTAGKAKVVDACVKYTSDEHLLDVYHRCVPAVQVSLKESLSKADRQELLVTLGVPPRPAQAVVEPELTVLERTLTSCAEYHREDAWNKTTLGSVWPKHHLRNSQYISEDSPLNLVEKLFQLLATFPPTRSGFKSTHKLPSAISSRFLSFLQTDLSRSLALVSRLCRWVDSDGKHHISLPESFAEGRYCQRFWHGLDLQTQRTHVEPFIANLLESNNGALLKSGNSAPETAWRGQVAGVYSIAMKAIVLLKDCKVEKERPNVIAFILGAIETCMAGSNDQSAIEKGASELIAHTIKHFLASLTATENRMKRLYHYHTLAKVLFESGLGAEFLDALTPETRTVDDIPDDGSPSPTLICPLSFYTGYVCQYLSTSQRDHVWAMLNDPEYFVDNLGTPALRHTALSALDSFPPSPSQSCHHTASTFVGRHGPDNLPLYALCDISDPPRERLEVYRTLIDATLASNSVREFITTMKFFVPRIKNEIPPDAGKLHYLFSEHTIIDLLRRATDEEAAEIASVYVAWENQVNEAVSPIPAISSHILMALQILWARCLNEHGLSKAKVQFVTRSAKHGADTRNEADELAVPHVLGTVTRRPSTASGASKTRSRNPTYPAFIQAMLGCLGTRWSKVPASATTSSSRWTIIRGAKGTGDSPSKWDKNPVYDAVQFILGLKRLYRGTMDKSPLPWWIEFRDLEEMNLRWSECRDEEGRYGFGKIGCVVELLLRTDDTAVYIHFVSQHIIKSAGLLLDRFITTGKYGVFNPAPDDYVEGDKIEPASWDFQSAARFSLASASIIRSNEFPLLTRTNPQRGFQFLLAPAILAGELARTAVHSVKRSLEHVPLASVPTFLEPPTAKPLKIGVFKELVRIITTYLELPEMQDLVKRLWDRPLHQDVRIALLQSILPALDSPQYDLAWYIIDKATASLNTLQADDTLFVLLAVIPEVSTACVDDVLRRYLPRSPVLADMATVTIPKAHCERYVENVLWPLTQIRLNTDLAESIKTDKKKSAELAERIPLIRSSSYIACFDSFVGPNNAVSFAERAAKDSRELVDIGLESYKPGNNFGSLPEEQLFLYLTECIGRCVAQNENCWRFLLETIDFLASRVAHFQRSPMPQGHRSIKQLQALRLADNFLFHGSESLCLKVTHDRMELLKPLATHGVEDFFATTIYQRRFNLFRQHVARVSKNGTGEDILPEARALLAENIKLSHSCHHPFDKGIADVVELLGVVPSSSVPVIRTEILAGDHGVAEAPWVNSIQLKTLEKTYSCTPSYVQELATFHAHVATHQPAFYQQSYASFESLIQKVLKDSLVKDSQLGSHEAFRLLVEPVIQRQRQSNSEEEGDMIVNLKADGSALDQARNLDRTGFGLVPSCVLPRNDLFRQFPVISTRPVHSLRSATLSFPYFFGSDDPSGGDIEDRSTKSTVTSVQALYDDWKARHASSLTQKTGDKKSTYSSSTALLVVLDTYKTAPKLILANPGLFFSCLCLSLSDADLHSYSTKLISSLREVLTPLDTHKKHAEWVPPAELTLSFAHKMLVELPDEVSDAVVGAFNVGVTESKQEAVSLLIWWAETFFSGHARYTELVDAEGRERLLSLYEELRVLAIGDGDAVVRVTALEKLRKASDFVEIPAL